MTMEGTGIVPVMDLNNTNRNCGYGDGYGFGGGWFIWIFVLFALMGGYGNNWNRGGYGYDMAANLADGTFTRNEIRDGFANQDTHNGIRGIQNGLCDGFYSTNTNMLQGFNGIQRDLCQGFSAVDRSVLTNRFELGSAIAENRFAAQQCLTKLFKAMKSLLTSNKEQAVGICA